MSATVTKQERFHFLDGLRAVAASMVVIHHSVTANVLRYTDQHHLHFLGELFADVFAYGVDLFFVLSGVVLLRPYLRRQRKFNAGSYFIRRVKRIYPPYIVAVLFAAFVIWIMNIFPTWYNERGMSMGFSWVETLKEMAIFNFDGGYYNLAWWSLQIEMLFYIFVPVIILIYPYREKLNNIRLVLTIAAGVALTLFLQLFVDRFFPGIYSLKYLVLTLAMSIEYPVCFLMGTLLAAYDFKRSYALWFFLCGLALLVCSSIGDYRPLIHSAYGLIFAALITFAFNTPWLKKILSSPFMLWLGERSYSLFLVHFSVFYLVDNMIARFTPGRNAIYAVLTRGVGIPLGLFAAMLLFHFVERRQAHGLVTGEYFWPWQVKKMKIED